MKIDDIVNETDSYRAELCRQVQNDSVVDFTARFYPRSWAHFELCKPGTMLLQPSEHAMSAMKLDYAAMRNMIYGEYPPFDKILETIKDLESQINAL